MQHLETLLLPGALYTFELPSGDFVRINLSENANGDWTVEHLDRTGELVAGLQLEPTGA